MRTVDLSVTFVYIIDESLSMSKGKVAAQVSHVAMMLADLYPQTLGRAIVLRADHETFTSFLKYNGVVYIRDAGLTEVPKDTITCIGFWQSPFMHEMTKSLRLV
jgi:peptidyl-tRNA hydrolase